MTTVKLYNLARVNTATLGTGTLTLGSAITGYLSFADAGVQDGDEVSYGIKDGSNTEVGRGTYGASGATLTRGALKSTNGDSEINITSGVAEVYITPLGEDFDFTGDLAASVWTSTDVASASTCDIGAATTPLVNITGTTTITSFGTSTDKLRRVRFATALILTHNATSLILPGAANITTAAGDEAEFVSDGSGNWKCTKYLRANGKPPAGTPVGTTDTQTLTNKTIKDYVPRIADRTALADADITNTPVVFLAEAGREGFFIWNSADLSDEVTADTEQGIYVPPTGDATGASGCWERDNFTELLRPEWFGAKGDGSTSDQTAFEAVIDWQTYWYGAASSLVPIMLRGVKYVLRSKLTVAANNPFSMRSMMLGTPVLFWDGSATSAGISGSITDNSYKPWTVQGFELRCGFNGSSETAITLDKTSSTGTFFAEYRQNFIAREIIIRGDTTGHGFQNGIDLTTVSNVTIDTALFAGIHSSPLAINSGFGFRIQTDASMSTQCSVAVFENIDVYETDTGISVVDYEGVLVNNSAFVYVNHGVIGTTPNLPGIAELNMTNSHAAFLVDGYSISGFTKSVCHANLFYLRAEAASTATAIKLASGRDCVISANTIARLGSTLVNGTSEDSSSSFNIYSENVFRQVNVGHTLAGTASQIVSQINDTVTTPVSDSGIQSLWSQISTAFTPTFSFATAGDQSWSYTAQSGVWRRQRDTVFFEVIITGTPTYTTASGILSIVLTGLPQSANGNTVVGVSAESSFTWPSGYSQLVGRLVAGSPNTIRVRAVGSAKSPIDCSNTQFPSATAISFKVQGFYPV